MESDTPETDAVSDYWLEPGMSGEYEIVKAEFARSLERRMNAETGAAEHANQQLNEIVRERDSLRAAIKEILACGLNCKDSLDDAEQMERIAKEALGENH